MLSVNIIRGSKVFWCDRRGGVLASTGARSVCLLLTFDQDLNKLLKIRAQCEIFLDISRYNSVHSFCFLGVIRNPIKHKIYESGLASSREDFIHILFSKPTLSPVWIWELYLYLFLKRLDWRFKLEKNLVLKRYPFVKVLAHCLCDGI